MLDEIGTSREELERAREDHQRCLMRLMNSARLASLGLLTGGLAHDINNRLCVISNHLQILGLRRNGLPPEVSAALEAIEANVARISSEFHGLLEFAWGRPGERQPTDLNQAMERVLTLLRGHPLYRRLRMVAELQPDLPKVGLDRAAWWQVMVELLTNTQEAMPDGGAVTIRTYQVATPGVPGSAQEAATGRDPTARDVGAKGREGPPGDPSRQEAAGKTQRAKPSGQPAAGHPLGGGRKTVPSEDFPLSSASCHLPACFSVPPAAGYPLGGPLPAVIVELEDEGPGIAPEDLPRVFDPSFTTKGPGRCLGLGLPICRKIVIDHGGRLWLESDGLRGTRAVIRLPASHVLPTPDDRSAETMQNRQPTTGNGKPEPIVGRF